LSPREAEVLQLVAAGLSNRQIAERLVLSPHTVANHLASILNKTGSDNRAAATAFAMRHGLL
jgi:DNA-binding CsgD family transcriptional regulator